MVAFIGIGALIDKTIFEGVFIGREALNDYGKYSFLDPQIGEAKKCFKQKTQGLSEIL